MPYEKQRSGRVGTRYSVAELFFILYVPQSRGSAPRGPRQPMGKARGGLLETDEGLTKDCLEGLVLGVSFQVTR